MKFKIKVDAFLLACIIGLSFIKLLISTIYLFDLKSVWRNMDMPVDYVFIYF